VITPGQHFTCRILVVLDLMHRFMPPERQVVGLGGHKHVCPIELFSVCEY